MFRSLLCYVTFEICPMYLVYYILFKKQLPICYIKILAKSLLIFVQILNSGSWFENRNIVIFCTAQNLMRKKILWFFFSVNCEMNEKIYTSNTHFHVKISLLFTTKMERWPRYPIFHRIWKKHFCNFRNCSSFIKLDK